MNDILFIVLHLLKALLVHHCFPFIYLPPLFDRLFYISLPCIKHSGQNHSCRIQHRKTNTVSHSHIPRRELAETNNSWETGMEKKKSRRNDYSQIVRETVSTLLAQENGLFETLSSKYSSKL